MFIHGQFTCGICGKVKVFRGFRTSPGGKQYLKMQAYANKHAEKCERDHPTK
jgi:hypothetical protein